MRQGIKRFIAFLTLFLITFSTAYAAPLQVVKKQSVLGCRPIVTGQYSIYLICIIKV